MAMKIKSGVDLCGMQITRFCIQNDTVDPTDRAVGRKYFNTGSGTAAKRERIYTGDTTITTDGWRDTAYLDDLDKLDIASNSDFLALKNKVDDFLEGVDVDNTINKWKELEAFLADYKETDTLADLLKIKANKDGSNATGTWSISISGNAATATKLSTGLSYSAWGATFFTSGLPKSIPTTTGITVGTLTASGIATLNGGATIPTGKKLSIGGINISYDSTNNSICVEGNFYATGQVASGGIADKNTSSGESNILLLEIWSEYDASLAQALSAKLGVELNSRVTALEGKEISIDDIKNALGIGSDDTVLHTGNYNNYVPSLDGTGATGTWGINISGNAATATSASKLNISSSYTAWGATFFTNGLPESIPTTTGITVGTLSASGLATFNGGATIPTGKTLKIGSRTISCDSNGALAVDGDFYATGQVASGGIADDVTDSDATSAKKKVFAIPTGTKSITLTHNLATRDVVVMIYENTSPYEMVLADITYDTTSSVTVTFGSTTTIAHRAVIIG